MPFGLPEPFSEAILYRVPDRRRVARAEQLLCAQQPYYDAERAA